MRLDALAPLLSAVSFLLLGSCSALQSPLVPTRRSSCAVLWGRVKRGKLAKNVTPGASGSKPSRRKKASQKSSSRQDTGGVSASLAEWASQKTDKSTADEMESTAAEASIQTEAPPAETFTRFDEDTNTKKKSKNARRSKQSARKAQEEERDMMVVQSVSELEGLLEEKSGATIDDILTAVRGLLRLQSGNLRLLAAGARSHDYRLAWVGSDDAVCHIGTGLHKVPLARLQEVFMTFKGKNRMELLEVIRILGPFPNVRNTLQFASDVELGETATSWCITMDSMVDGTGKEILAGTEDNIRKVELQVYFADENAIVAVVPPDSGDLREDPFENNGANVLVFVREDDLDTKLDALRVS